MSKKSMERKIYRTMVAQHPPEKLANAYNAYNRRIKEMITTERNCIMNDENCFNEKKKDNVAVNSHSIQKKHLKKMSTKKEIHLLKADLKNPLKKNLDKSNIKSSLTFPGFCSYHDRNIFSSIENTEIDKYENDHIFLFSLRTISKYFCDTTEELEREKGEFKCILRKENLCVILEIVRMKMNEYDLFDFDSSKILSRMKRNVVLLKRFLTLFVADSFHKSFNFFRSKKEYRNLKSELENYVRCVKKRKELEMEFRIYKNVNSIAFSKTIQFGNRKGIHFLHITIIPTENGSDVILSCDKNDFSKMKLDCGFERLFAGNESDLNEILNSFKDEIAHNIDGFEDDFGDKFFLEWDIPLATIQYVKLNNA